MSFAGNYIERRTRKNVFFPRLMKSIAGHSLKKKLIKSTKKDKV